MCMCAPHWVYGVRGLAISSEISTICTYYNNAYINILCIQYIYYIMEAYYYNVCTPREGIIY